jgi:glyoxylase-like metal-dependent hydrolase (beta-lactamase superfamily II)
MQIKPIGRRGALFIFNDLDGMETTVYAINGRKNIFLIDTFLGPDSMAPVKESLAAKFGDKPVIIFNTHYHWDHIWGNCAFDGANIYSHRLCRRAILEKGHRELEEFSRYKKGTVKIVFPNITFNDRLMFEDEEIEMFYSPGHSIDSASLFDHQDSVLVAGDNIEAPLPYLMWPDLEGYCRTLEGYKTLDPKYIISGHCPEVSLKMLKDNLQYLRDLISGNAKKYEKGNFRDTHLQNVKTIAYKENG